MMIENLHPTTRRILNLIRSKPSGVVIRELCEATGRSSTSTIHSHIRRLQRLGLVYRDRTMSGVKPIEVKGQAIEPQTALIGLLERLVDTVGNARTPDEMCQALELAEYALGVAKCWEREKNL